MQIVSTVHFYVVQGKNYRGRLQSGHRPGVIRRHAGRHENSLAGRSPFLSSINVFLLGTVYVHSCIIASWAQVGRVWGVEKKQC